MFKKVILVLLTLLLVSCNNNKQEEEIIIPPVEESLFIEPINDVFLFDELNSEIKNRWQDVLKIDGSNHLENYQLEMLFKDIYEDDLVDIYGNVINLKTYDKLVLNFVSVDCGACKLEIENYINDLVDYVDDVQFVQYFGVGTKEEILDLYKSLNVSIPENLIIIEANDDVKNYMKYDLMAKMYPTFVFYLNNKVSFNVVSKMSLVAYKKAIDIAFNEPIKKEELINKDGIDIFTLNRDFDDVKNDLRKENLERIEYLNDKIYEYTDNMTFKLMGKKIDFNNLLSPNAETISQINDYSKYVDKDLVIFYESFSDSSETDKVEYINSLIEDDDVEYIVVLIEGFESQSRIYEDMDVKFHCPVVSNLGYMPRGFYSIGINVYPTALFIKESTFTGAYAPIENIDKFNYAINTFLKDDCIALKANN